MISFRETEYRLEFCVGSVTLYNLGGGLRFPSTFLVGILTTTATLLVMIFDKYIGLNILLKNIYVYWHCPDTLC